MPRETNKNKSKNPDQSFSKNSITNERMKERQKDFKALEKVKKQREGRKFIHIKISSTPNTWIEKEIK